MSTIIVKRNGRTTAKWSRQKVWYSRIEDKNGARCYYTRPKTTTDQYKFQLERKVRTGTIKGAEMYLMGLLARDPNLILMEHHRRGHIPTSDETYEARSFVLLDPDDVLQELKERPAFKRS